LRSPSISDLPDPTKDLYPVGRNEKYALDRPVTDEKTNTNYNNFYEFGSNKSVAKAAQALKLRPWTVKIDGRRRNTKESPEAEGLRGLEVDHHFAELRIISMRQWVILILAFA
jgi:sulfoxide reductase catalytic subunit YedY